MSQATATSKRMVDKLLGAERDLKELWKVKASVVSVVIEVLRIVTTDWESGSNRSQEQPHKSLSRRVQT